MDFDRFIDVERLRSLDALITARIGRYIEQQTASYFLNQHRLDEASPYQPGVREIWLSQTVPGTEYNYLDLDKPQLWQPTEIAAEFQPLMDFVETLPFAATGRVLIIFDDAGNAVPPHRDHLEADICNEFIWMRTNFNKRFFMMDGETGEKLYVTSHSAWFDSVNQFHGADASSDLTFSIRVDGVFNDDFRAQIPNPATCRSAAPALWAMADSAAPAFIGSKNNSSAREPAPASSRSS